MTNEQKVEELRKTALPNPLPDGYGMWLYSTDVDEVLIKMAEWKEQQMIEKAYEWLKDNIDGYMVIDEGGDGYMHFSLINDFRKAMEEYS